MDIRFLYGIFNDAEKNTYKMFIGSFYWQVTSRLDKSSLICDRDSCLPEVEPPPQATRCCGGNPRH